MNNYHNTELANEMQNDKKKCKKIMNSIIKSQNRICIFHYLSRYAGKGVNRCLKKLITKDRDSKLTILLDRKIKIVWVHGSKKISNS